MKRNRYISVMGTMGSGKTTAARLIAKEFGYQLVEENFGENAFLPRFYADMKRWAFHSQTFFLMEKISQMLETPKLLAKKSVVQDTPIQQDAFSYAKAQHVLGHMDDAEWKLYQKIYKSFEPYFPKPDLIVYLETSIDSILQRIESRGRGYEQKIPQNYLELLDLLNHKWLNENSTIPVLNVSTDGLNVVKSKQAQETLIELVREKAMNMEGIEVIIWDVDGTLYETHDLSHEVYVSAYKAIQEVMHWPEAKCIEEFDKVHEKITLSATEAVGIICNITTAQSAILTDKYLDRMRFITHDDKLIALFEELSGFSHYILGNGSKDLITQGLHGLGLDPLLFKEIVTSEIVGVNKPKDDGFRYIAQKTGLPFAAHLMVGDRDRVDLEPAKALGMKTALVWSIKPSTVADITLPTVYELSQVLV